jgi:hypothetical protein
MPKDRRYITVKNLISAGYIKTFREIFDTVPKSVIAADLGFNNDRINNLMANVDRFIVKDLFSLASLIEVEEIEIMKLICNQHVADKKGKRKK